MASGACSLDEPQPKLVPATIMSPFLHFLRKIGRERLHAVLAQDHGVGEGQIAGRDDDVRVDVVAEFPDSPF